MIKLILNVKTILAAGMLVLALEAHAGVYEDMLRAIELDDSDAVAALLKRGFDVNSVGPNGDPLLTIAARNGKTGAAKVLLAARPKIDARNGHGETALMLAAFNGHLPIVQALLVKGASVNHPGWTPLSYAATRNHLDVARVLIKAGAKIDAEADNGTTALMMASREGHLPMVLLLLEHGANINHMTKAGYTSLELAIAHGHPDVAETLLRAGAKQ